MVDEQITSLSHGETGNIGFVTEVSWQGKKSTGKRMMASGENNLHRLIRQGFNACFEDDHRIEGCAGPSQILEVTRI